MKKVIIGIVVVLVIIAFIAFKQKKEEIKSDKPVVKIGFSTVLAGNLARVGVPHKKAAEMAIQDLNKKETRYRYELIVEDHDFDLKKIIMINQKFLHLDKVDAIVDSTSKVGLVTSPMATQNRVIHVNLAANDSNIADGQYNFLYHSLVDKEIQKTAEQLQKIGAKNVSIVTAQDQGQIAAADKLKDALKKIGIQYKETMIHTNNTDVSLCSAPNGFTWRRHMDLHSFCLNCPPKSLMLSSNFRPF